MVFGYYKRLTTRQQRIYRRSDEVTSIGLPHADHLEADIVKLAGALAGEDRAHTTILTQNLINTLATGLRVVPVRVEVLEKRPSHDWGELQGLYTPAERRQPAVVTLWMRTAKRRRVVAFRTFLRTVLHEFCHHLDYELLKLDDSFHTEGFYKRESSLFNQLMREYPQGSGRSPGHN